MKSYNYVFVSILVLVCLNNVGGQRRLIPMFRVLRDLALDVIGRSISEPRHLQRAISTNRIQKRMLNSYRFPCADYIEAGNGSDSNPWTGPRSKERPTSVHTLRPGDIDVIGALGDSLTAANGAGASNIFQVYVENRGVSWSIGGQGTWREYFTIPNMLKMFNPNLIGYSLADALTHHRANQFNVAEAGAMSRDLPHMAKELAKRMRNDPRVNMKEDWKMVTIMIGANDFCIDSCFMDNPRDIVDNHFRELHTTLSTIRDEIPRTFVNIVPAPDVSLLAKITPKPDLCELTLRMECPCFIGLPQKPKRNLIKKLIKKWQKIDVEIGNRPEFNDKEDFAVISQPFDIEIDIPTHKDGRVDFSYFSTDCFHFSQKGYARAANALWNNIFEPVGGKSMNWKNLFETVKCPTKENPYIYTRVNSVDAVRNDLENNIIERSLNYRNKR